ncbi:2-C-methyl-D-erythritol 4-phosphate cytidylyltransferase [Candidatus Sumerlaeota bacterium]|nr:2-C-methyl-D-erythritol 4-phosphate cytidylyltransferase [Candidatus Sumerlaeota bacterium]
MISAIIVAGGQGRRFKEEMAKYTESNAVVPKQFLLLGDKPDYIHSVERLARLAEIDCINVVVPKEYIARVKDEVKQYRMNKVAKVIAGGERRQDSVWYGLNSVTPETEFVVIHDGVRPFPPLEATRQAIKLAQEKGAVILAQPATDTIKIATTHGEDQPYYLIEKSLNRHQVWLAQTPQVFRYSLIMKAYQEIMSRNVTITDEAQAIELTGEDVYIVPGSEQNIKITTTTDFTIARGLLTTHK